MSYQVISRKWRPALFGDVVCQEHVVKTLTNAITMGRVGHAYLFSGPRGVGKTTVARILARCLNCEKGPTASPCNECGACKAIMAGSSVDVLEIDGASNTGVEHVRELRESVKYAPASSRHKVYIIDEVHMLSDAAFNALLKTLEEPPPHVIFIFATTEPQKIPLTIHSRCQRFDFRRIPLRNLVLRLSEIASKEGVSIDEDSLYLITREAEGSLRDAQSLLEQVISFSGKQVKRDDVLSALGLMDRTVVFDLMEAVIGNDAKRALNLVENIHDFGYDLKKVVGELLEHTRDLAVVKTSGGEGIKAELPESEAERLNTLASCVGKERIEMLFSVFTRCYEDVLRSSTPRFTLEMALIKAASIEDMEPVGDAIARLEALLKDARKGSLNTDAPPASMPRRAEPVLPPKRDNWPRTAQDPVKTFGGGIADKKAEGASAEEAKPAFEVQKGGGSVEGFFSFLREKDGRLLKPIESSGVTLLGSTLTVSASAENAGFLMLKKDALEAFCREYFGRRMDVDVRKGASSGRTLDAADKTEQNVDKTRVPGGDKLIKDALSTLGGRVIEDRKRG